jgi:beta-glucanase (GH16 family)
MSLAMRQLYICLFILGLLNPSKIYAQCKGNLIWSDEFNGSSLDLTKWTYDLGNGCPGLCGWGNSEKEYYTNQNVNVTGGYLYLTAINQNNYAGSGTNYTSGKIHTRGKFDRTYGRFEARIMLPAGVGMWPAFWLLPTSNVYGGWPTSGEIDIMENRGDQPNFMGSTLHYGNAWPANLYDSNGWNLPNGQSMMADFHIFAVEWTAADMKFYVDGALIKTETKSPNSLNPASNNAVVWPWDQNFYIILNLALGGWYSGNPTDAAILASGGFPKSMLVDYVRVYDMAAATSKIPFGPPSSVAVSLPGKIEAENYDDGCENYSYNDFDIGNNGNVYRFDNVDIEACTDVGGGYDIGWGNAGDWTEYTVNIASAGNYNFTFRTAGDANVTSTATLLVDGASVAGTISVPETNGWQTWQDITVNNIPLPVGQHVLRFTIVSGGFNTNYINVTPGTLPVTIGHWSAQRVEEHVLLEWTTYKEENNDKFILERSADGLTYESIYVLDGHATTSLQQVYSYVDEAPLPGKNYYRLKQKDLNGEENICGNSLLVLMNAITSWEVYPVPVTDELQLSGLVYGAANVDVLIYDSRGILIAERSGLNLTEGIQYIVFKTDAWSEGVYTVNIINHTSGRVVKKRLVKSNK